MKTIILRQLIILLLLGKGSLAQTHRQSYPLSVSVFATSPGTFLESWRLPSLPTLIKSGAGIQAGTEFYYRNRPGWQLFQTLTLGAYQQFGVENGLFLSSAFGYRQNVGAFSVGALLGASLLRTRAIATDNIRTDAGTDQSVFVKQQAIAPTLALETGLRLSSQSALFVRYQWLVQPQFDHPQFGVRQLRQVHVGGRFNLHQ